MRLHPTNSERIGQNTLCPTRPQPSRASSINDATLSSTGDPLRGIPGAACADEVAKATTTNVAKITRNSASNKRVYEAKLGGGAAVHPRS
jgi:hypothetical protein